MSNDYKIENAYEGGECHLKYTAPASMTFELPKPKYNLVFQNAEGNEVGVLNFDGPGLSFEGVADLSAITFMDWVSKKFMERLQEERNNERKALLESLLALKKGVAGPTEYVQGRWDLIGEFQDVILERIEK